jgi:hypothetical protein
MLTNYANEIAYKSQQLLKAGDPNTAFQLAAFAHRYIDKDNIKIRETMVNIVYGIPDGYRSRTLNATRTKGFLGNI